MVSTHPAYFLKVSQSWKYSLWTNWTVPRGKWCEVVDLQKCDSHMPTTRYEPRCSMGRPPSKAIQVQRFFRKGMHWPEKLMVVKTESAPKVFFSNTQIVFLSGFENDTSCFHRMRAEFLLAKPQLPGSHPACFFAVSQHWEYILESNNLLIWKWGVLADIYVMSFLTITRHYEPGSSMRRSLY